MGYQQFNDVSPVLTQKITLNKCSVKPHLAVAISMGRKNLIGSNQSGL